MQTKLNLSEVYFRAISFDRNPFIWLTVVLYLIAASDITSVQLGGVNIRLSWIFLPVISFLVWRKEIERIPLFLCLSLFFSHALSSIVSGDITKGFAYSFWIIFNFIFFFHTGYSIALRLGDKVWNCFLIVGRLSCAFGVIFVLTGFHQRAQFIYYEPSYFAIGLVPYIFATAFWSKRIALDVFLITLTFVANQSANMLICIFVAFTFWLVAAKKLRTALLLFVAGALFAYASFRLALINQQSPNHAIAVLLSNIGQSPDIGIAILQRAGNRFPRLQAAWQLMQGQWLFGLGPGNYIDRTQSIDFQDITGGLDYLDPAGLPVINIFLESATNAGILAVITLVSFVALTMKRLSLVSSSPQKWMMIGSCTSILLMLQIESSYLRAYVWLTIGLFFGWTKLRSEGLTPPI
jgi:hypothetical protein